MLVYALRRFAWSIVVLLLALLLTFALMRGIGGSPFHAAEGQDVLIPIQHRLTAYYHLDRSWPVQFATYLWHIVRFDFGPTLSIRDASVGAWIKQRVPVSLELTGLAVALAVVLGFALGIGAALRRGRLLDRVLTTLATTLVAVPVFLFAAAGRSWLVGGLHLAGEGWGSWNARWLPVAVLALAPAGYIARLVRAGIIETLAQEHITVARAKGLRMRRIVLVHILPGSLTPFLTAAVPMLALLITSAFFVEQVFGIPGAAELFIVSAERRDYPLVLGLTTVLAVIVVYAVFLADLLAAALDVRLREARR